MSADASGICETDLAQLGHQGRGGRFAQIYRLGPPLGLLAPMPASEWCSVVLDEALENEEVISMSDNVSNLYAAGRAVGRSESGSSQGAAGSLAFLAVPKLLRLNQVLDRVGLSRSTLYALIKAGEFPRQRQLSARSVGWVEAEVNAWIASKIGQAA